MNDHLISRNKFLDALVLDADNKTDLIQVHQALEKAVISPDEVRGEGCAYCKEDRDGYTMPLEKNAHAWVQYPNKLVVHLGGHLRKCEIKYCPMCGRRLEVSEDA